MQGAGAQGRRGGGDGAHPTPRCRLSSEDGRLWLVSQFGVVHSAKIQIPTRKLRRVAPELPARPHAFPSPAPLVCTPCRTSSSRSPSPTERNEGGGGSGRGRGTGETPREPLPSKREEGGPYGSARLASSFCSIRSLRWRVASAKKKLTRTREGSWSSPSGRKPTAPGTPRKNGRTGEQAVPCAETGGKERRRRRVQCCVDGQPGAHAVAQRGPVRVPDEQSTRRCRDESGKSDAPPTGNHIK